MRPFSSAALAGIACRLSWTAFMVSVFAGLAVCNPGCAAAQEASQPVAVTITDKGCEPNTLSVPAGKTTFKIKNQSKRAVEWEILDGVMVVEERENIIPGFVQSLTADLKAGQYQMTCGLLTNPKGVLTVTAAATSASAREPSALDLVGPLAEYKVYVAKEVGDLVEQTKRFAEAVKAGKLDEARNLYAPTRQHYERIEPVAELFSDLDKSMDARADDFETERRRSGLRRLPPDREGAVCGQEHGGHAAAGRAIDAGHAGPARPPWRAHHTARQDGRRGSGSDRGSRVDQDQRRGRSLQRHRPFGFSGQCRRRAEDLQFVAPTDRNAKFGA